MIKALLSFLIAVSCLPAFAQKSKQDINKRTEAEVPAKVRSSFAKDFPGKEASWSIDYGNFKADFKFEGVDAASLYDETGHHMQTAVTIEATTLPAAALTYTRKNHSEHKIIKAAKITDDKNVITYSASMKKFTDMFDLFFDAKGKYIRQEEVEFEKK